MLLAVGALAIPVPGGGTSNFRLVAQPALAPRCVPRVVRSSGNLDHPLGPELFRTGNIDCLEARPGEPLIVEVQLCGGREVGLGAIGIERQAFAKGGLRATDPRVLYSIIYPGGRRGPTQRLGNNYRRAVEFPEQRATGLIISIEQSRQYRYPVYERLCAIRVNPITSPL